MIESYKKYLDRLDTNPTAKAEFEALFPRSYRMPVGYWNPRYISAQLADTLAWLLEHPRAETQEEFDQIMGLGAIYRAALGLKWNDAPTYCLAQDFGEAIWKATLDDGTLLKDIKFATKAALICLPEDFTLKVIGVRVPFLVFSWFNGADLARVSQGKILADPNGILTVAFNLIKPDGTSLLMSFDCSGSATVKSFTSPPGTAEVVTPDANLPESMTSEQTHASLLKLAINVILGMAALPQLIDGMVVERPRSAKKKKVLKEICAPRYIGFKYKRVPKPNYTPGTHASPIMHRRNGHWKQQPYGPERTLRKLIWIDEYWVCVPEDEQPKK